MIVNVVELVVIKPLSVRRPNQAIEIDERIFQVIATFRTHRQAHIWPAIECRVLPFMTLVTKRDAVTWLEPAERVYRSTKDVVSLNTIVRDTNNALIAVSSLDEAAPQPEAPAIRPASLHSQYQSHLFIDEV
ncbi:hypothetical protein E4T63_25590 [Pseudomonas fluorescens]|uniref:Uncharacterized protein n=1 Tax=Pseudomonas fluorescens TaxID=294 RepID=A0AAP8Z5T4_PSEFL|nr:MULTISPECIES: hypothetical protein [Pseudomonas]QBX43772.1 hypothetical protein E4T63_25590 [Pseudomonas fluorescens]